jgi:hypothetical protein
MLRPLLALLLVPAAVHAATTAQLLTPLNTSVLGGERQVYSVRFLDAAGRPAVGESVLFDNDACGLFDGGSFTAATRTDANGVASMGFTARAQGITCWINVQAGVTARFNVFTYTLGQVSIDGLRYPADPRPGEPYVFTAGVGAGVYPIFNADLTARIVPSTSTATISPGVANTGQAGRVDLRVQPGSSDFEIEIGFKGLTRRFAMHVSDAPLQDMWWAGTTENGWGMSVVQHGEKLFTAIYAYDAAGAPTWYVMPAGTWNAAHTAYSGALYSPHGTPYSSYDAARLVPGPARGSATLTFDGLAEASLAFEIDGVSATKRLSRQSFGPVENASAPVVVGDMWWGGAAQNGWGLALLQQYRTIFGVWFTYGADGSPTWFVMPSGFWKDDATWEGRLYRTTGSPWLGKTYDPALLSSTDVGGFSLHFDATSASFAYTVDGKPGMMTLMRQPF